MQKVQMHIPSDKVTLPSFPWSEVELRRITVGEQRTIRAKYSLTSKSDIESKETEQALFEMVLLCIVDWNLYNGEEKVAITIENLNLLPQEDMTVLIAHVNWIKVPGQEKNE